MRVILETPLDASPNDVGPYADESQFLEVQAESADGTARRTVDLDVNKSAAGAPGSRRERRHCSTVASRGSCPDSPSLDQTDSPPNEEEETWCGSQPPASYLTLAKLHCLGRNYLTPHTTLLETYLIKVTPETKAATTRG